MSGHTPGPWVRDRYCPASGWVDIRIESDPFALPIASTRYENTEANARLIAAAPELLEALRGALSYLSLYGPSAQPALLSARAAIAKATGNQTP